MYLKDKFSRIRQGDIFRDIEFVEDVLMSSDNYMGVSYLSFPYIVVLSQDCDLESDVRARQKQDQLDLAAPTGTLKSISTDTVMESLLICPAYEKELFMAGKHLEEMGLTAMSTWTTNDTKWKILIKNNDPRYHFLLGSSDLSTVDMVIDFKHYYTIPRLRLYEEYNNHFIGTISEIYRALLNQRFAHFLSRIGVPGMV